MTLDMLKMGESCIIKKVDETLDIYTRLVDIGLINGTKVTCVLVSPFDDPKAFLIRGTVIALRNNDSMNIEIIV